MIEAFNLINRVHDFISIHQITPSGIVTILFICFVISILSVREMMCWFLKVHAVRKDVRDLKKEILTLQGEIRLLQRSAGQTISITEDKTPSAPSKTKSSLFKIFH